MANCLKCNSTLMSVEISAINLTQNLMPQFAGVVYSCPSCHAALGVGMDPLALKSDIVGEVLEGLGKR